MFHAFANPTRFQALSAKLQPVLAVLGLGALLYGVYLALLGSPADYQQGETVRIMYVHVPSAYLAVGGYAVMAVCSLIFLVWRHTLADIVAQAAAPVGAAFTALTLITGSLWGKPMWGTWWAWDARLTSMLILLFLYFGYMAVAGQFGEQERERKVAAIVALIGAINLPIIKFSVDWWNTLHQPASIFRMGGPSIDASMLTPLFVMLAGFSLVFAWLLLIRIDTVILERKAERLRPRA